jgi:seryl-tRNA synthetase
MISLELLRTNTAEIKRAINEKDPRYDVDRLIALDTDLRTIKLQVEDLRKTKNELATQAKSGVTQEIREQSIELGIVLKAQEIDLEAKQAEFDKLYLECPNVPDSTVPTGNKESNKVIKEYGTKPKFDFDIKNHVELGKKLEWFNFEAAVTMTGARFVLYQNEAVNLVYALTMFMLKNNIKYGFKPFLPPYLVNEKSLEVASNFPKFRDQVYSVTADNLYLTPTAEVNLTNLYRDHIFNSNEELPKRMTAWTSCFRREAGTYGATEQGLIRIHQFEKAELYTICEPDKAQAEQDLMLECAENILQSLGLHYRVSLLAGQDCSFASARTYDIEVWMPGQNAYYEVSSISNCTDFQARRGKIRYRDQQNKTQLVYTLNGSSLALPRLMVALMEVYQQPDGTIKLPKVLLKEGLWS